MGNPFINAGGRILDGCGYQQQVDIVSSRRDLALRMYREANVAMPDVHIADRNDDFEPLVLGDDGQPMTLEDRRQRMAGLPTSVDDRGRVRGVDPDAEAHDYREDFEDVEQEEWGTAAVANRPGLRKITPRDLELPITEETLESAKPLEHDCD